MRVRSVAARAVVLALTVLAARGARADPDPGLKGIAARIAALEATISTLQAQVAALQASPVLALGPYVSVDPDPVNGLKGPHVYFTGVNVHVRSGSGSTDDGSFDSDFFPEVPLGPLTGLGNLVIGYNEPDPHPVANRSGSHNLIIGAWHEYSAFGGLVAGRGNNVLGPDSSVTGGSGNTVGDRAFGASVSGGVGNTASSNFSSVSGGGSNTASGGLSSVCGGEANTASGTFSSVSGGQSNTASRSASSVSGGKSNTASGRESSVSGGQNRQAPGDSDWVAGEFFSDQ
jgi:hypothetical protein